ncbi:hypothetical protein [Deinococcus sp. Leaf326]|uniref:ATP-binding protein n=1 Tax=Deinococcus sp. Leaf326 TaxID=1736338 RepID=UPI0012E29665|nr:hypothetical protein [Deinococcus sp. Leaf326]
MLLLALLAYRGPMSRSQLRYLLWPDAEQPGASLRVALARIEEKLPGAILREDQQLTLQMPHDLAQLRHALLQADPELLLANYSGAFLEHVNFPSELDALSTWAQYAREALAQQVRTTLFRLVAAQGDPQRYVQRLLTLPGAPPLTPEELHHLADLLQAHRVQPLNASSLPLQSTLGDLWLEPQAPLVGRRHILQQLFDFLERDDLSLLTLLGPGGTGKTRLVLELARSLSLSDEGPMMTMVALERLRSPNQFLGAVAGALQLNVSEPRHLARQVVLALSGKPHLLILDGFEGVVEETHLLLPLLRDCPLLKIIITSRTRLPLVQGGTLPIGGLSLDASSGLSEAASLFLDRVHRFYPNFEVSSSELALVEQCSAQLQGSPLGLELLATWMRTMTLTQVAQLLEEVLQGTEAMTLAQQQPVLEKVVDRSWDLLNETERQIMQASAVFEGDFSAEAAFQVLGARPDQLASLTDRSLLRRDANGRFSQHALLLSFCRTKLQADARRRRQVEASFAGYFGEWIVQLSMQSRRRGSKNVLDGYAAEYGHLVQLIHWAGQQRQPTLVIHICTALFDYWILRQADLRALTWLAAALALTQQLNVDVRMQGLWALAGLGVSWGEVEFGRAAAQELLELSRQEQNPVWEGYALLNLGGASLLCNEAREAQSWYAQSLTVHRRAGVRELAMTLLRAGDAARSLQDWAQARRYYEEGLLVAQEVRNEKDRIRALRRLMEWHLLTEEVERGLPWLKDVWTQGAGAGYVVELIAAMDGTAAYAAQQDAHMLAAQLWGAWERQVQQYGLYLRPFEQESFAPVREAVLRSLGEANFRRAWDEGKSWTLERSWQAAREAIYG